MSGGTPLDLVLAEPGPQRRLTVLVRPLLVLPCLIALYLYSIPGGILTFAGWFCALAIGRLPRPFSRYQVWLLRYTAQVSAYGCLLTGRFPGFGFDDDHPVDVTVVPDEVSRLTVFFRYFMAIPVNIAVSVLGAGVGVLMPFLWLITLVRGRLPRPGFDTLAAITRYQLRYSAWYVMVYDEYPGGLFEPLRIRSGGDIALPIADPVAEAAAALAPPVPPAFRDDLDPDAAPLDAPATAPAPAGEPAAGAGRTVAWVPLSDGGRRLLKATIPLGIVVWIAFFALLSTADFEVSTTASQRKDFMRSYSPVVSALGTFSSSAAACASADDQLSCTQEEEAKLGDVLVVFADEVEQLTVPLDAIDERIDVQVKARELAELLDTLANAPTEARYSAAVGELKPKANALDTAVEALLARYD